MSNVSLLHVLFVLFVGTRIDDVILSLELKSKGGCGMGNKNLNQTLCCKNTEVLAVFLLFWFNCFAIETKLKL